MRLYCQTTKMDTWSVVWLTRVWTYMGHVARCQVDTPLRHLVACTRSSRLALGGLRPSWLSETIAHKFRLCYQQLCQTGESPYWERQAQDRQAWMNMLPRWLMHWNANLPCPNTTAFLGGHQLVLVEGGVAALRPARTGIEDGYARGLVQVRRINLKIQRQFTFWLALGEGSRTACIFRLQAGVPLRDWCCTSRFLKPGFKLLRLHV